MANPNFVPNMSTNEIWRDLDDTRCLTDDLDTIESDIAALEISKANITHTHSYNDLTDLPTDNAGGDADTVDGKHASDFASASDMTAIQTLVGDTAVSSQISTATSEILTSANTYTDNKIADLINGAPTTLDTLGEIATAMEDNADVVSAIETSIGTKANASDLTVHVGNTSNPHGVTKAQLGLGNVENKSSATIREELTKANVTDALGYTPPTTNTTYSAATTSAAGLMSAADKTKLDGIATGADKTTLSGLGITATATELNYVDGVTSNIQTQLNGKAASSHGTHVTFTTTVPKVAGTAAVGTATTVSRSDHVHPVQTTVSGNAGSATKLATARTIRTNLASTSTASFNGTANVTPGVTGTLPIANGGTGATTAAAAVTKLGISDYVVAQGTSGIWTYRKWNSGVAECWGSTTISYKIDCTTQRANAVYADDTFKGANASLPSGLFTSVSFATANARTNGYSIAQVNSVNTTTLSYRMWCPYSTLLSEGSVFDFHVKGRWK